MWMGNAVPTIGLEWPQTSTSTFLTCSQAAGVRVEPVWLQGICVRNIPKPNASDLGIFFCFINFPSFPSLGVVNEILAPCFCSNSE